MPLDPLRFSIYGALAAAIAGIFAFDMHVPLGLGVPFLYLLVVFVAIRAQLGNWGLLAIVALCTALTGIKLLLTLPGPCLFGPSNRIIFALLIWALLGFEFHRRRVEALHLANRQLHDEVAARQQAQRTINDYAERLHALANQLVEAQEVERKHLAAELHDRIGQNLSALNINLSMNLAQISAQVPNATAAPVTARIRDSLALVEKTTEMVRGVMEELHPTLLDQYGLPAALRWYGEEFARRTGIRVDNEAKELFPRLRGKVEMTLFRIVQEALTNVAKHAQARRVAIGLRRSAPGIELEIRDDGVGLAPERAAPLAAGRGWGLAIMAERARAVGADFHIDTAPGQGTTVAVNISNGLWEADDDNHGTDR